MLNGSQIIRQTHFGPHNSTSGVATSPTMIGGDLTSLRRLRGDAHLCALGEHLQLSSFLLCRLNPLRLLHPYQSSAAVLP